MATLSSILNTKAGITPPLVNLREVEDGTRRPYSIASISSTNFRQNQGGSGSWTSSDQFAGIYGYLSGNTTPSCEAFTFSSLGSMGRGTSSSSVLYYDGYQGGWRNKLDFSAGDTHGGRGWLVDYPYNSTNYNAITSRIMFLRNFHPSSAQSITLYPIGSSYWSSGYEGTGLAVGTPNTNKYSTATSISWSVPWALSGNSGWSFTTSASVSIPSQTTVVVLLTSSAYYYTNNGGYWHWQSNGFYNLTGWSNNWIQPDLRMTWAAHTKATNGNTGQNQTWEIWPHTAALYGDR